jgi:hypothetical protein
MKKSSKKQLLKKFKNLNENLKFIKSISISKLILSKPIFLEVLKKQFKFWWYEC